MCYLNNYCMHVIINDNKKIISVVPRCSATKEIIISILSLVYTSNNEIITIPVVPWVDKTEEQ